jgi:hypothetical protein
MKGALDKLLLDKMIAPAIQRKTIQTQATPTPTTSKGKQNQDDSPVRNEDARKVVRGTGPKAATIMMAEPKFWVHLSDLDPKTEEEALTEFLNNQFDSNSIKCIKLLPKNRPINSCESISFRIWFPTDIWRRMHLIQETGLKDLQ